MNNRSALSVTREITRKLLRIRTCVSVSKQRTSTPFRMNTYKKHRGRAVLLLTPSAVMECGGSTPLFLSVAPIADSTPGGRNFSSHPIRVRAWFLPPPTSHQSPTTSHLPFISFLFMLFRTLFTLAAHRNRRNPFSFFRFRTL